jgi:uncharacterized protein
VAAAWGFQRSMLYFPTTVVGVPNPGGPPMQVLKLTTHDGEKLVAWFLPPRDGQPVILFFGGNGSTLAGQSDRWKLIADHGAGVLALAYRGYSGSTGHPTETGLHEDAETAYAWLAARYPPGRIVIHGHSLGTGVAVRLAATHPARALVLEAPFTSAEDVAAELFSPWLPVRGLMWDRFASRDWIGKVHMPVLIVHGTADRVIPYRLGHQLFDLANQPKSFVSIEGGGHDDLVEHGLYDRIWAFLAATP